MPSSFAESPEFQRLLRRESPSDLSRIALEIARDAYPELEAERYLEKIESLAQRIRDRVPSGARPRQVLGQINWVLFVEEGYHGNVDDYYDPRNSYLNEVIDRKTGIPISLSTLYWTLADRLGLEMAGVNLPWHFMLRVGEDEATIFVDPFHGGSLLDRDGCRRAISEILRKPVRLTERQLAPCRIEQVVSRMLRNLKAIYFRNHEFSTALAVQERLVALNPTDSEEQRDLGMIYLQIDRPAQAIVPFQSYLDSGPSAEEAEVVRALLRAARREVASWN